MSTPAPIYLDATKLAKLDCRRKFGFAFEQHLESSRDKDALKLGVSVHTLAEVWNNRPENWYIDDCFTAFVPYILKVAQENTLPTADVAKDKRRSVQSLFDIMTAYCYREDTFKTAIQDGKPMQEVHFQIPTEHYVDGRQIILCGYIDRVVLDEQNNYFGLDYKTTLTAIGTYWADQFASSIQMNLYMWAIAQMGLKPKGLMICGMQPLVSGARISVLPVIGGSRKLLDERINGMLDTAVQMLSLPADTPNTNACHQQYACEFWAACNSWGTHRKAILQEDYRQAEVWSPEIPREPHGYWTMDHETILIKETS